MRVYVDVIIENLSNELLLVSRGVEPFGWAFPGGYVDEKEMPSKAAVREVWEETGAEIELLELFAVYPFVRVNQDCSAITIVYTAKIQNMKKLAASSDVLDLGLFPVSKAPQLINAHKVIFSDYQKWRNSSNKPSTNQALIATRDEDLHHSGAIVMKKAA